MQYLKKEVSDEFDFLLADKNDSLLLIDTMILMGMVKHFPSSQNSEFGMSLQYLKNEVRDEVNFLQVDFNTLDIKVFYQEILSLIMGKIKHSQSTQSSKIAITLQYLRKLRMEFIFCMQINIKVSTSWHYLFSMEVARHVQSTQNRKLVIFLQYIKKKVLQLL